MIEIEDIGWLEACGNYVAIHVGMNRYLVKQALSVMEARLDKDVFLRIHRSKIINMRAVKELQPFVDGRYVVLMKDNTKLYSSRRLHRRIHAFLNGAA